MSTTIRRHIALLLLASFALTPLAIASDCQAPLDFDYELQQALRNTPTLKKLYLKLKKRSLKRDALERCKAMPGGCTPTEFGQTVAALVESTNIPNKVGYGFLIGGMAATAALGAGVTTLTGPETSRFLPAFVNNLFNEASFLGIILMSPWREPLEMGFRRFLYSQTKGGAGINVPPTLSASQSPLELQADRINATYTLREQQASDRIIMFRNAVRLNFDAAARAIEMGDQAGIIAEIADAAMAGYRHFRDLNPQDPTIVSVIRATFLRKVSDPALLAEPVLREIQAHDPDFFAPAVKIGEVTPKQYYESAIRAWLTHTKE